MLEEREWFAGGRENGSLYKREIGLLDRGGERMFPVPTSGVRMNE